MRRKTAKRFHFHSNNIFDWYSSLESINCKKVFKHCYLYSASAIECECMCDLTLRVLVLGPTRWTINQYRNTVYRFWTSAFCLIRPLCAWWRFVFCAILMATICINSSNARGNDWWNEYPYITSGNYAMNSHVADMNVVDFMALLISLFSLWLSLSLPLSLALG